MNAVDELVALPKWTQSPSEEWANSISHGIGFVAALIGTPILLFAALSRGSLGFFIGAIVFTVTTLLLYFKSMLYHAWPQTRGKSLLQVMDHSAIFWLIAGTYTPFALGPLHGVWGWTILGLIWTFAVLQNTGEGDARYDASPGMRIPTESVADELGISRMPVRDALRRLEGDGVVTIFANRGASIAEYSSNEVIELTEMRSVLEGLAARVALDQITDADLEQLSHLLRLMDKSRNDRLDGHPITTIFTTT